METKKISIVIATFNASKTLERCLATIILQMTEECELIIIDGGSSDKTNQIIMSYGTKITYTVSESDKGIYDAWNKGIKVAKGEWLMFIGADDILLPNALTSYLHLIKEKDISNYDYVCAYNRYVDRTGRLLKVLGKPACWSKMRKGMSAAHVGSLHNRKLFNEIGEYDLNFKICADYELLLRKKGTLKSYFYPKEIAQMEVGGMSFSNAAIAETYNIRKSHNSINPIINKILYLRDLFAFNFFYMRKEVNSSKIISRIKGENFSLDPDIPTSYLILFSLSKLLCLIYGVLRFRTFKLVFVHPSSKIICANKIHFGKNFTIGRNCYVNALSHKGLVAGQNVSIGYGTHIELTGSLKHLGKGIKIGNDVGLGTHGCYGSGAGFLEIGDYTIFGNYVSIHPENHNFSNLDIPIKFQGVNSKNGVKVGKNCWIGAKVTILDGTVIGDNSIVAAGAVVKGLFPENCIIGGVPAKIIKYRDK